MVAPRAKIRIYPPNSRKLIQRGELGELHVSNPRIIEGYINVESGSFYEEEKTIWLITGDQAMMDDEGVVYIMGRYKDIIIRAGEKISEAAAEACMGRMKGVTVSSSCSLGIFQFCFALCSAYGGISTRQPSLDHLKLGFRSIAQAISMYGLRSLSVRLQRSGLIKNMRTPRYHIESTADFPA